jgi:hypothetical protein
MKTKCILEQVIAINTIKTIFAIFSRLHAREGGIFWKFLITIKKRSDGVEISVWKYGGKNSYIAASLFLFLRFYAK